MMWWHDGYGWMGLGGLWMLLFWGALLMGVFFLVRWIVARERDGTGGPHRKPLEILQERYARGEITREQFQQMRQDIAP